nr:hypothetical protein CFP56_07008 [Quercus suber]
MIHGYLIRPHGMKVLEKQTEFMKEQETDTIPIRDYLSTRRQKIQPVICDPLWLSEMLEAGFISKLIITYGVQISLFPKIIQEVDAQIGGLNYMRITIWSTLPAWDNSYYMEVQPTHILILIHDWGCIPEYNWYTGDTYLPLDDPDALA